MLLAPLHEFVLRSAHAYDYGCSCRGLQEGASTIVIDTAYSLVTVAKTKRVTTAVLEVFSAVLKAWVDKEHGGNQTRAGRALGVTQSHVSAMLGGVRGPGLNTLILMRDQTGLSIDQMLGFEPARKVSREEYRALLAELEAIRRQEAVQVSTPSPRKRSAR